MRLIHLLVISLVATGAGAATSIGGGPEIARIVFCDKYDNAFKEAAARNVPVLVIDCDGWATTGGHPAIHDFFADESFIAAVDQAVLVVASQEGHQEKKQLVDGIEKAVCSEFGAIPCSAHQKMLTFVFRDYADKQSGALQSPLFVVVTPDHKEIARLGGERYQPEVIAILKQATKQLGPGLGRSDYVRIFQGIAEAKRLADAHDFAPAVSLCDELAKVRGDFAPQQELKAFVKKLEETSQASVRHADELWSAGRHLDALLEADDVKAGFGKMPAVKEATSRLALWEKAPEAKDQLPVLNNERAARKLYLQAIDLHRKGDVKKALSALDRLAKAFPETRFAKRAEPLRDALREKS